MEIRVEMPAEDRVRWAGFWERLERLSVLGPREVRKIADAGRLGIAENFTREGAAGEPWAPLAPATVEERRRLGFAGEHPILQRTKVLKRSLTERGFGATIRLEQEAPSIASMLPTRAATVRHVCEVTREEGRVTIEIGTTDPRFPRLHAGGSTAQGRRIPPRPMTVLSDEAIQRVEDTAVYVLDERVERA